MPEGREIRMVQPLEQSISVLEKQNASTPSLEIAGRPTANTSSLINWDSNPQYQYTLVVDSSVSKSDSTRAIDQFGHFGLPLQIVKSSHGTGKWYCTALGQFKSFTEAELMRQKMSLDLPEGTWVYRFKR